ncbi:MAG TPA: MauE/DoxX family redox-associated membrane protein [Gaiellaceae bacterium]
MRASPVFPWIGLAVRLAAAGIWLVAGVAKIAGLTAFKAEVAAYDVAPSTLVEPIAYSLPFIEVALGAYLAVGLLVRPAAALSVALMLLFIGVQAQAWARGLSIECGCFGGLSRETVGAGSIARDVALSLPSLLLLIRPARHLSLDRRLLGHADAFGVSAAR